MKINFSWSPVLISSLFAVGSAHAQSEPIPPAPTLDAPGNADPQEQPDAEDADTPADEATTPSEVSAAQVVNEVEPPRTSPAEPQANEPRESAPPAESQDQEEAAVAAGDVSSRRSAADSTVTETPAAAPWAFKHFFDHIKVRGYTQLRFNRPTSNIELVNLQGDRSMGGTGGFLVRRARVILYGDVHPQVFIYLQPDFASSTEAGLHFVQLRDWYFDLADKSKEFRVRLGQSKVPYGFENMQSSQNRLPLDRSDALNSAVANERDLGAFFYYAPAKIRERFAHLVSSGLKGSGDYGVVGIGVYNGQTANKPELNTNKHIVARLSYPFLIGKQFLEVGGGGYHGKYVVSRSSGIGGEEELLDTRAHLAFTLFPQPFGFQAEYNVGVGPELSTIQSVGTVDGTVYSGTVEEKFLHGGYVLASYKIDHDTIGTLIPYTRGILYEGGKKHETNAPGYSIRELDIGIEWQPIPAFEFVGAFVAARRSHSQIPYQVEEGYLGRFQIQVNY